MSGASNSRRPPLNPNKLRLARTLDATGLNSALAWLRARLVGPHIRILNYHDVGRAQAAEFERQLRFYLRHFVPAGMEDLLALQAGRWPHRKPGLALTFDDGFRSHAEVVAPLLEKHGFSGWFFVPAGFPEMPVAQQLEYARTHGIDVDSTQGDGRFAMSWDELRRLDRRHVVGCHTMNHTRLSDALTPDQLDVEIAEAKRRMEERLEREVPVFCWVGGEEWSYSRQAAQRIRQAGFRISFMTNGGLTREGCDLLQLQRTNVEADYPRHLMRFQLSGFLDWMYSKKRRRVNRLTGDADPGTR